MAEAIISTVSSIQDFLPFLFQLRVLANIVAMEKIPKNYQSLDLQKHRVQGVYHSRWLSFDLDERQGTTCLSWQL